MEENKYLEGVRQYQNLYFEAVLKLRMYRIKCLLEPYDIIKEPGSTKNIDEFEFDIDEDQDSWLIKYIHFTQNYRINYYDSNVNDEPCSKTTTITFGYIDGKYKITGNGQKFEIYKNSRGKIRILARAKEDEYDLRDQENLIKRELNNCDLPEYFALRVISSISYSGWTPLDMITYLDSF